MWQNKNIFNLLYFSFENTKEVVSEIIHLYWSGAGTDAELDSGTLTAEIPINSERNNTAYTKLIKRHNESNSQNGNENRKKRSLVSPITIQAQPLIALKVRHNFI